MRNIYVPLPDEAIKRLRQLAERELRGTKKQAAVLILEALADDRNGQRSRRAEVGQP